MRRFALISDIHGNLPALDAVHADTWVGAIVHRVAYDIGSVSLAMRAVGLPETLVEALAHA